MKALICVAHGSKRRESNEEFLGLVDCLRQEKGLAYTSIKAAFLEFSEQSLQESLASLMTEGIKEIVIYPYFLNMGKHVRVDIPQIIENFQVQYPNVKCHLCHHVGHANALVPIIINNLKEL